MRAGLVEGERGIQIDASQGRRRFGQRSVGGDQAGLDLVSGERQGKEGGDEHVPILRPVPWKSDGAPTTMPSMKALVYTAPHKVETQVHADPAPKPGEVVVRVRAAGVCGSDLLGFLGKSKKRVPPLILGHEIGGEVHAVGSEGTRPKKGQR